MRYRWKTLDCRKISQDEGYARANSDRQTVRVMSSGFGLFFLVNISTAHFPDFCVIYWRVIRRLQIDPVPRFRILSAPPYSLVSVTRLHGTEQIQKEFRPLGAIQGPGFAPKPNFVPR